MNDLISFGKNENTQPYIESNMKLFIITVKITNSLVSTIKNSFIDINISAI